MATLVATTLYYLVNVRHTTVSDFERLKKFGFSSSIDELPAVNNAPKSPPSIPEQDPAAVPSPIAAPPPPPPDPEVKLPNSPTTTTNPANVPVVNDLVGHTPTSSATVHAETVTGEELLVQKPGSAKELKQIFDEHWEAGKVPPGVPKPRWQRQKEHNPVAEESLINLPSGKAKALPKVQYKFPTESRTERSDRQGKQAMIREAFKHAWQGYVQHAMPHDELLPLSNSSSDSFMGWGATLIDSLDTLWIMDLKEDFEKAVEEVKKIDFLTSSKKQIPMFETVIRIIGGLISAYDLTDGQYPELLNKTIDLADVLMGAFDTPNRMPDMYYKWAPSYASQQHRSGTHVVLAELGSLSMEFTRLAQLTKDQKYFDAIARVQNALEEWQMKTEIPGLWPFQLDASGCQKSDKMKMQDDHSEDTERPVLLDTEQIDEHDLLNSVTPAEPINGDNNTLKTPRKRDSNEDKASTAPEDTLCKPQGLNYEPYAKKHVYAVAARADSTYEYMPKMHRLLGARSPQYENMYKNAMKAIREQILYRPMVEEEGRPLLFPAAIEIATGKKDAAGRRETFWEATHLGCFAGGMVGLGAKTFGIASDMELAQQLTDGCVWAYESTPTKIMPESFALTPCQDSKSCPWEEAKWHAALDPKLQERLKAVEAWNREQQKILEQAAMNVINDRNEAQKDVPSKAQPTVIKGGIKKEYDSIARRADVVDDTPPAQKPSDAQDETKLSQIQGHFVPKVALSHEKYVKARIQEERLPTSYTKIRDRSYVLRPEAIESVFIMWRLTGEEDWRRKGWAMFQAVQEGTHTAAGNAPLLDVTSVLGEKIDKMESFWLGETLKYFYLLFSEPSVISLDDYVL